MTLDEARARWPSLPAKQVEKAFAAALAESGAPEPTVYESGAELGGANAIGLPEIPRVIAGAEDGGKGKLTYRLVGQVVVFNRQLAGPVTIAYITQAAHARWHEAIAAVVEKRLAKAAP